MTLIFYDARQQFAKMRSIGQFIRKASGEDAKAVRVAAMIERIIDQVSILDFEVTVEHTDGQRNLTTAIGQLMPAPKPRCCTRSAPVASPLRIGSAGCRLMRRLIRSRPA